MCFTVKTRHMIATFIFLNQHFTIFIRAFLNTDSTRKIGLRLGYFPFSSLSFFCFRSLLQSSHLLLALFAVLLPTARSLTYFIALKRRTKHINTLFDHKLGQRNRALLIEQLVVVFCQRFQVANRHFLTTSHAAELIRAHIERFQLQTNALEAILVLA